MYRYALKLTGNKQAAKAIIKNCRAGYNKNLAWFNKQQQRPAQKKAVRLACHHWLHTQLMQIISNTKNQPACPTVTTTQQSLTQHADS